MPPTLPDPPAPPDVIPAEPTFKVGADGVTLAFRGGECTAVDISSDRARRPEHLATTLLGLINEALQHMQAQPSVALAEARHLFAAAVGTAADAKRQQDDALALIADAAALMKEQLDEFTTRSPESGD